MCKCLYFCMFSYHSETNSRVSVFFCWINARTQVITLVISGWTWMSFKVTKEHSTQFLAKGTEIMGLQNQHENLWYLVVTLAIWGWPQRAFKVTHSYQRLHYHTISKKMIGNNKNTMKYLLYLKKIFLNCQTYNVVFKLLIGHWR